METRANPGTAPTLIVTWRPKSLNIKIQCRGGRLANNYPHGLARPVNRVIQPASKRRRKILHRLDRPSHWDRGIHPLHVRDSDAQNRRGDKADSRIPGQRRRAPTPAPSASPTRGVERTAIDADADHQAGPDSEADIRAADADSAGAAEG